MANSAWNPFDLSNVTLTGANLIATSNTASGGSFGMNWVRADTGVGATSGKFYWELTMNAWAANTAPALAPGGSPLTSWNQSGLLALYNDGTNKLYLAGATVASGFTGEGNGVVTCLALDVGAKLFWIRVGATGPWNGTTNGNPAAGTGGVSLSAVTGPYYPAATFTALNQQATANFGDSAFAGAVPSGFTAGWPYVPPPPSNAQVTQASLEMWSSTTTVLTQAMVTQVALEQWAQVTSAQGQARVMVMA